jgi:hypothetical protein
MIKGRDFLITISLFFLLLYSLIGDCNSNVWSYLYFQSIYIIINRCATFHRNKTIRLGLSTYTWVLSIAVFTEYILKIPINDYSITVVFVLLFSILGILTSKNNINKSGFFKQ